NRVDMSEVSERTVFVPGFGGRPRPEVARRSAEQYVAARLVERVLQQHGQVGFDRRGADFVLIPWLQILGGITTHREYRSYGYPIYLHEEDQAPAVLIVFLY